MTSPPEFGYKDLDHRQVESSLTTFGLVKIALEPSHAKAMLAWIHRAEALRHPRHLGRISLLLGVIRFFGTLVRIFVFHTKLMQAGTLIMPAPVAHSLSTTPDGFCLFQFNGAQDEV